MHDVRASLGVKSVRIKIEKRVLERISQVIRMDNRRMNAVVLGWCGKLEGISKMKGKKWKTVLCWRTLKEARIDSMEVEEKARDREKWKKMVRGRVAHI